MFKGTLFAALTALAAAVSAAPTPSAVTGEFVGLQSVVVTYTLFLDVQILQFALTLEHIENTFYNTALAKFSTQDFVNAGYPDWVRGRFAQLAGHEDTHVRFLTETLGTNAVPFCEYDLCVCY